MQRNHEYWYLRGAEAARGLMTLTPTNALERESFEQGRADAIIRDANGAPLDQPNPGPTLVADASVVLTYDDEAGVVVASSALLSQDSQERKDTPIYSGVMAYFPLALAAVARVSKAGNDKHNPGQPLHWSRHKSTDHKDCIARHLIEADGVDPATGELHAAALAWRALANLQIAEEKRLAEKAK